MIEELLLVENLQNESLKHSAFEMLVDAYKERLYWHIRRILLDHDDTDDVLQNTFIKCYENIDSFKGNSKLYSWLYRIATNEALSFLIQKSRKLGIESSDYIDQKASQLESDVYFEGDAIETSLQKALASLPEKQRLVFNMKYFEEMKYEEISEILETSVGALKASYHHATTKIKEFLTEH